MTATEPTRQQQTIARRVAEAKATAPELVVATAADEVMLSTTTFGLAERCRSIELVAEAWGLEPPL